MILHVIKTVEDARPDLVHIITGKGEEQIRSELKQAGFSCRTIRQVRQKGTAHAVAAAKQVLGGFSGQIVVLYGDTPFIRTETIQKMQQAIRGSADVAILGFHASEPKNYGRLVIDSDENLERIVEFKDANPDERKITYCNSGVVAAEASLLFSLIDDVDSDNASDEFYLTDIVGIARSKGFTCATVDCSEAETLGINDRRDLAAAENVFQSKARQRAMDNGVTLVSPETVYLSYDTRLAPDTIIEPFVCFGPGVVVNSGARIRSHSHLENCTIGENAIIGPFARIRPGSTIGEHAKIGNFVEVKASTIGEHAKASHLTYIGDADVGDLVNVGAGTVICNYDGKSKNKTRIGDRAFIGSDSILVAPVTVGNDSMTAAGSVITNDVPNGALGISRSRQSTIKDFALRFFGRPRQADQANEKEF